MIYLMYKRGEIVNKPILVVMAAGMGSRYGGLKQIDRLGPNGETMLDYSIQDALKAGFKRIIFIITKAISDEFKKAVGNRYEDVMEIHYAFQALDDIPKPYKVPNDRVKPWGTAHAVWTARNLIDAPFAVINADDYYGPKAYEVMYQYLEQLQDNEHYAMVGYKLIQTLSENGAVSRGLCSVNDELQLISIDEQTQIEAFEEGVRYTEDGINWDEVNPETIVSMNLWGFPASFVDVVDCNLPIFLEHTLRSNPLKGEYFLPSVIKKQIEQQHIVVDVLMTDAQWFGVTYIEDKPVVQAHLAKIRKDSEA